MADPIEILLRLPGASDGRRLHLAREEARRRGARTVADVGRRRAPVEAPIRRHRHPLGAPGRGSRARARRSAHRRRDGHGLGQVRWRTSCPRSRHSARGVRPTSGAAGARPSSTSRRRRRSPPTSCRVSHAHVGLEAVRAATVDGDNSREERQWARDHANYVVTNPDILHRTMLPGHQRWARFLSGLRYVVVDECHHYRGVFGSHVSHVLRRLRRIARTTELIRPSCSRRRRWPTRRCPPPG